MSPLPKGRHKLSRELVAASQKRRLLKATIELGTERGFASLTLTDIVGRAGVARSTFYEHFADKEQCFMASFDYAAGRVAEHVFAHKPRRAEGFDTPAHAYIARFLDLCTREPSLVQLVAADAEALGPAAAERQRAISNRIANGIVTLRNAFHREHPTLAPITHVRAHAIVGAITEVIRHTFHTTGTNALPALQPELATVMLTLLEAPSATATS
jgi:AcrR family transcriptional regulator